MDWPVEVSAAYTTCMPSSSAATAELLKNLENVSPLSQANGPSPQSTVPVAPLNWIELKAVIAATSLAGPKEIPPLLDFVSQMPVKGRAAEGSVWKVR